VYVQAKRWQGSVGRPGVEVADSVRLKPDTTY
jgi:restriction endonuclease Mrr